MVDITIGDNTYSLTLDMFRGMKHARRVEAAGARPAEPLFPERTFGVIELALQEISTALGGGTDAAIAAGISASNAATSATTATSAKNQAEVARDVAVAAAVSSDYPFATTAGTASTYTVDFTPNRVVGDGFSMRCNFHVGCNASPTISVDGGTAYEIVDGLNLSVGGVYRSLDAGDIFTGMNLVLMFDSNVGKMVIAGGFPIYKLSRNLDVNGFDLVGVTSSNVLTDDVSKNLSVGYTATPHNIGTITTGTVVTPNAANGNLQRYVNGGAHTLAPPSTDTAITIQVTNNGSAGAITTSGFSFVTGDTITTTDGHDFFFHIMRINGFTRLSVEALQ